MSEHILNEMVRRFEQCREKSDWDEPQNFKYRVNLTRLYGGSPWFVSAVDQQLNLLLPNERARFTGKEYEDLVRQRFWEMLDDTAYLDGGMGEVGCHTNQKRLDL